MALGQQYCYGKHMTSHITRALQGRSLSTKFALTLAPKRGCGMSLHTSLAFVQCGGECMKASVLAVSVHHTAHVNHAWHGHHGRTHNIHHTAPRAVRHA